MATLGEIALLIKKQCPDRDLELIESWMNGRYREVLDRVPWRRQEVRTVLGVPAVYSTGTLAVVNGSSSVAITTGAFSPDMSGRVIRFPLEDVLYVFTYVDAANGSLDRLYEGETGVAKTFEMHVRTLDLPAGTRIVESVLRGDGQPLDHLSRTEMRFQTADGKRTGKPEYWCETVDGSSYLPRLEIYPLPVTATSLEVELVVEADLDATDKPAPLASWMNPQLIIEGVLANDRALRTDYQGFQLYNGRFEAMLDRHINKAAERLGPIQLRGEVRPERVQRWARPASRWNGRDW